MGIPYLLKGGTQTLIVSLYPIIFWAILLKLVDELKPIPISILNNPVLRTAWTLYFYIGVVNLAFGVLVTARLSLGFTSAYRSVPSRTEILVRDLLKSPTTENELAVKSQIKDLLRKTLAGGQLAMFFVASAGRQVGKRVFALVVVFLITGLGSYIVAIAIVRSLSPILPQILPFQGDNLGFPLALGVVLVLTSAVDINYFVEKERASSYKALRGSHHSLMRTMTEFGIDFRLAALVTTTFRHLLVGSNLKTGVECPDAHTLTGIFERTMKIQLEEPNLLFVFDFEDIWATKQFSKIEKLDSEVASFIKKVHPKTFVGFSSGKCVLIAESDMLDVRRMDIWTHSPSLTRNLVTKATNIIQSEKKRHGEWI